MRGLCVVSMCVVLVGCADRRVGEDSPTLESTPSEEESAPKPSDGARLLEYVLLCVAAGGACHEGSTGHSVKVPESESPWMWVVRGHAPNGPGARTSLRLATPEHDPSTIHMVQGDGTRAIARVRDFGLSEAVWMHPSPTKEDVEFVWSGVPGVFALLGVTDDLALVEARRVDDGEVVWRWAHALPPKGRAQFARSEATGRLVVYVSSTMGANITELDAQGSVAARRVLHAREVAFAATPWSWQGGSWSEERDRETVEVVHEQATLRFSRASSGSGVLERVDEDATWRWTDPDPVALVNGRLVVDSDWVYLATGSAISSGVTVRAFDLETGALVWEHPLHALGRIVHSEYMSAFTLGLDEGALVVHGRESGGTYIEWVDPKTGRTLVNSRFFDE